MRQAHFYLINFSLCCMLLICRQAGISLFGFPLNTSLSTVQYLSNIAKNGNNYHTDFHDPFTFIGKMLTNVSPHLVL